MAETEYKVKLDAFEGPLDLLFYLVRKAEVEITEIPVAEIADQYMAYLEGIERVDIDKAGEFLLMAATLTEIKSRVLGANSMAGASPEDGPAAVEEGEDPLADLVKQLLEYKRFRDAAEALEHRFDVWSRRHPAGRSGIDAGELRAALAEGRELDIEDLSVVDLMEAFQKICDTVIFDRLGDHEVLADDTPIELHAEDMLDRLRRETAEGRASLTLREIFEGRTRGEMLGLFLALLELVRRRAVRVHQEGGLGEIVVGLRPAEEVAADGDEPPHVE
ncbi:MAG: segregation/condensation protein A [Phycisphaerales bacterium]|nr:segregation/condensation protein A [Phycisphaerales bacterium]